jgi:hypothetical protein
VSAIGLGFLLTDAILVPMLAVFLAVTLYGLWNGFRRHGSRVPLTARRPSERIEKLAAVDTIEILPRYPDEEAAPARLDYGQMYSRRTTELGWGRATSPLLTLINRNRAASKPCRDRRPTIYQGKLTHP